MHNIVATTFQILSMRSATQINALTIDVEDYFQVSAFAPYIPRDQWEVCECRVERNVDRLLSILEEKNARATFFTLGWVAKRYPQLSRRIVAAGHELASHGYGHERVSDLTEQAFYTDISVAKKILEDQSGCQVKGYRAPSFSIGGDNLWAFDCLEKAGYCYSSSIYPIRHDHYGMPNAPRFPHQVRPGLIEIPVTTARFFDKNWPASGGGYFRLLPYAVSHWLMKQVHRNDHQPIIFYLHPWEIDASQPRVSGTDAKTRFRHYVNLRYTEGRLKRLLTDFRWGRMDEVFLGAVTRNG